MAGNAAGFSDQNACRVSLTGRKNRAKKVRKKFLVKIVEKVLTI